jgi:hypothetical protein
MCARAMNLARVVGVSDASWRLSFPLKTRTKKPYDPDCNNLPDIRLADLQSVNDIKVMRKYDIAAISLLYAPNHVGFV